MLSGPVLVRGVGVHGREFTDLVLKQVRKSLLRAAMHRNGKEDAVGAGLALSVLILVLVSTMQNLVVSCLSLEATSNLES